MFHAEATGVPVQSKYYEKREKATETQVADALRREL